MTLPVYTSPHFGHAQNVTRVMAEVLLALVPAIIAIWWYFGWGVIINIVIATTAALATEAAVLKVRKRSLRPLSDLSAVVTAVLFAVAVPPLLPWWMTVLAIVFAILVVKQLYGGLGYNPFNPAMAGYVVILVAFPMHLNLWTAPRIGDLTRPGPVRAGRGAGRARREARRQAGRVVGREEQLDHGLRRGAGEADRGPRRAGGIGARSRPRSHALNPADRLRLDGAVLSRSAGVSPATFAQRRMDFFTAEIAENAEKYYLLLFLSSKNFLSAVSALSAVIFF